MKMNLATLIIGWVVCMFLFLLFRFYEELKYLESSAHFIYA
ncbi:Uncharacterised protein [Neisseria meningitidis]|nr:Uncharacterised protein [Neisseria meningitidis]